MKAEVKEKLEGLKVQLKQLESTYLKVQGAIEILEQLGEKDNKEK